MPSTVEIVSPRPHPAQAEIKAQSKRFNVVAAGRRWGKNTLAFDRIIETLLNGKPAAWFSPSYKTLTEDWRTLSDLLRPVIRDKSEQEHRLKIATNGVLEMWTTEDGADAARGRAYALVVLDEAASVRNLSYAWQQTIRPMLTDFEGDAWFLSTPKGMNTFWELWKHGQDAAHPDWASWQRPSSENPHLPTGEIDAARREVPASVFRQEYLAEFLEGVGGIFRHIGEAVTAGPQERALPGHTYVIGVDWAKYQDFTVFCVIDASLHECIRVERMQLVDYDVQVGRLEALASRYQPDTIVVERTGQDALMEQLRKTNLPFRPFDTTRYAKKALIDRLALAFENRDLALPNDPVLIGELQAFRAEKLAGGELRYGAPAGQHDDTVIALALAWSAAVAYPKLMPIPDWRNDYDVGEPRDARPSEGGYVAR